MPFDADRSTHDESTEAWHALLAARRRGSVASLPADSLFGPLLHVPRDRSYVIAQLGQSLDGRIANGSGESRYINCPHGITHLHRLRALVDAVLIGASTAIADDPRLDVRHVEGDNPARVVLDPRGRVPAGLRLFRDDGARRIAVVGEEATVDLPQGVEVLRLRCEETGFAPADVVAGLHAAGLRRLLVEGGSRTVSRFLDAGALDRLHLIVAPLLLGDGPAGISLQTPRALSDCVRPPTRVYRVGGDVLFDCDLAPISALEPYPLGWNHPSDKLVL
ncbi:MAG: riboflavin deaminase [Xanthobacteraceae bacterium]|jgi:riboflavin-specific deaminase-like protein|nr:riboflavin deaminase [Xanthobacteraceae bacterium]